MIVRDATDRDLAHVVWNMRDADAREVYASRFVEDPRELVKELAALRPRCLTLSALCGADGRAIGLIGAVLMWPGACSAILIATDDWPKIAFAATRWVKRVFLPIYVAPTCHRAQCEVWEGNAVSIAWLESMGAKREGRLERYGKNGEHFLPYAWLRSEKP